MGVHQAVRSALDVLVLAAQKASAATRDLADRETFPDSGAALEGVARGWAAEVSKDDEFWI